MVCREAKYLYIVAWHRKNVQHTPATPSYLYEDDCVHDDDNVDDKYDDDKIDDVFVLHLTPQLYVLLQKS